MLNRERSLERDLSFSPRVPSFKFVIEFERKNPSLLGLASLALPSVVPGIFLFSSVSLALLAEFEREFLENERDQVSTTLSSREITTILVI